jgi:predicted DsbA family dithiol-disulfide isomerase
MNSDKLSAKLFSQRPDLREFEPAAFESDPSFGVDGDVDDTKLSLSAWKSKLAPAETVQIMKVDKNEVLSEDAIREMFSPRSLTAASAAASAEGAGHSARSLGIVRAVKKNSFAGDADIEAKDFLVDEHEGLIGSQG